MASRLTMSLPSSPSFSIEDLMLSSRFERVMRQAVSQQAAHNTAMPAAAAAASIDRSRLRLLLW